MYCNIYYIRFKQTYNSLCFERFFRLCFSREAIASLEKHKRIVDKVFCQSPAYRSRLTDKLQFTVVKANIGGYGVSP